MTGHYFPYSRRSFGWASASFGSTTVAFCSVRGAGPRGATGFLWFCEWEDERRKRREKIDFHKLYSLRPIIFAFLGRGTETNDE